MILSRKITARLMDTFQGLGQEVVHYKTVQVEKVQGRTALQAFGPHPEHQHVVNNFVSPIRADSLILDFEV